MTNRNSHRRNSVILAAALASGSALILAQSASAQYANGNGQLHDANNRVGSGGSNGAGGTPSGVGANAIVGRNVTSGRQFIGPLPSGDGDPRAFGGPVGASPTDVFSRQANAPASAGGGAQSFSQPKQFYSDNLFTAPPAGSTPLGFNGGYINNSPSTPSSLASGFNVAVDASSLQSRTLNPETLLLNQAIKSGDTASLMAQLDQNGTGLANISPVYGLRTTDNTTGVLNSLELPDRSTADDLATMRMRQELRESVNPNGISPTNPNGIQPAQPSPDGTLPPRGLNDPIDNKLGQSFDTPISGPLSDRITGSQMPNNQFSPSGIIPDRAGQIPSMIPPAEQQSTLLATLQHRLEESGAVGKAIVGNEPVRSTQAKPAPTATPGANTVGAPEGDQALNVSSLAVGIKVKDLHDLLAGAEELVRTGKYDSAIQKYVKAANVVPNNPLPILGKAQAELAGGYYAKSETDLRTVFRSNPALLMMRFDLTALIPKDRIAYIRKDLQALAANDPKAERPWFVLAYLDYNTGDSNSTEKDLNEAEKRADGGDWAIRLLRKHWDLPTAPKAETPPAPTVTPTPAPTVTPRLNK